MMQITIDGITHNIEDQRFRRILVCAAAELRRLKKIDGKEFPQSDAKALQLIRELQFQHSHLI